MQKRLMEFDWTGVINVVAEAYPECPVCTAPIKPEEWGKHVEDCIKIENEKS